MNTSKQTKPTSKPSVTRHRRGSIATLFKRDKLAKPTDVVPLTQVDDAAQKAEAKQLRKDRRKSVGHPSQVIFNERLAVSGIGL